MTISPNGKKVNDAADTAARGEEEEGKKRIPQTSSRKGGGCVSLTIPKRVIAEGEDSSLVCLRGKGGRKKGKLRSNITGRGKKDALARRTNAGKCTKAKTFCESFEYKGRKRKGGPSLNGRTGREENGSLRGDIFFFAREEGEGKKGISRHQGEKKLGVRWWRKGMRKINRLVHEERRNGRTEKGRRHRPLTHRMGGGKPSQAKGGKRGKWVSSRKGCVFPSRVL